MERTNNLYEDISKRTGGDIYIGVVGPVRTGKSTFIKQFMDKMVLPYMESDTLRERATDELPQSATGRTIMTTEPKFVPEQGAHVTLGGNVNLNVRLIDCVGYIVPSALGYIEEEQPRMVKTPWYDEEIPFNMAAEIGTRKVITDHSTIGLLVTTDGSIGEIPRAEYEEAERRVVDELNAMNRPFAVLLNSTEPHSANARRLAAALENAYGVPVCPVNCTALSEEEIEAILERVLFEFPIKEIGVELPRWMMTLDPTHPVRKALLAGVKSACGCGEKIKDVAQMAENLFSCDHVTDSHVKCVDLGTGKALLSLEVESGLFYEVLSEVTGLSCKTDAELMQTMTLLADAKTRYDKIKNALDEAEATGYGIVMPAADELELEEPEILRQGGRYGVRLRAKAPSFHIMRADIETEVSPIVGSEHQSEELVNYLLREFEEEPQKIWESNIFGTSLYGLVNEGLHTKLNHMPVDARMKLKETVERVINDGCNGLICIIV